MSAVSILAAAVGASLAGLVLHPGDRLRCDEGDAEAMWLESSEGGDGRNHELVRRDDLYLVGADVPPGRYRLEMEPPPTQGGLAATVQRVAGRATAYFDFGSASLTRRQEEDLRASAPETEARLYVVGFADPPGTADVNLKLSLDRARRVREILGRPRIEVFGLGEDDPSSEGPRDPGRRRAVALVEQGCGLLVLEARDWETDSDKARALRSCSEGVGLLAEVGDVGEGLELLFGDAQPRPARPAAAEDGQPPRIVWFGRPDRASATISVGCGGPAEEFLPPPLPRPLSPGPQRWVHLRVGGGGAIQVPVQPFGAGRASVTVTRSIGASPVGLGAGVGGSAPPVVVSGYGHLAFTNALRPNRSVVLQVGGGVAWRVDSAPSPAALSPAGFVAVDVPLLVRSPSRFELRIVAEVRKGPTVSLGVELSAALLRVVPGVRR